MNIQTLAAAFDIVIDLDKRPHGYMPLNMATVRLGLIYLASHAYTLERGRTLVMLDLEHMRNFLDVTGTVVAEILDCLEGNGLIEKTYANLCQVAKSEYYVLF